MEESEDIGGVVLVCAKAPFEPAQAAVVQIYQQDPRANQHLRFDHPGRWEDQLSDLALVVRSPLLMGTVSQALQDHGLLITRAKFRPSGCTDEKLMRRLHQLFCQSPLPEHLHAAKESFGDVHTDDLEQFLEDMWLSALPVELFAEPVPELVSV